MMNFALEDLSGAALCGQVLGGDYSLALEAFAEASRRVARPSLPFDERLVCERLISEFTAAGGLDKLIDVLCQPEITPRTAVFLTDLPVPDGFSDHNDRVTTIAAMMTVLASNKLVCKRLLDDDRVLPKLFWFFRRGCVDTASEVGLLSGSHYCLEVLFQLGQSKRGIKQMMENGLMHHLEYALHNPPRFGGVLIDVVASRRSGQRSLAAHQPYKAHFVVCLCSFLEVAQAHLETLDYNPVITEDNIIVAMIELAAQYPPEFDEDGCLAILLAQIAQLCRWDRKYYKKCRVFFRQREVPFSSWLKRVAATNPNPRCVAVAKHWLHVLPLVTADGPEPFSQVSEALMHIEEFGYSRAQTKRALKEAALKVELRECSACQKKEESTGVFRTCTRCKAKFYCSRDCQVSHWKSGHVKDCKLYGQVVRPSIDRGTTPISTSRPNSRPNSPAAASVR